MIGEQHGNYLLTLARSTLLSHLAGQKPAAPDPALLPPDLLEKKGCFVTLRKSGQLRGCIGMIIAEHPLVEGVMKSALDSAFHDPRFEPVTFDELGELKIEISILTVPRKIEPQDAEGRFAFIKPGIHGIIIKQGFRSATYLPQVWHELPDKEHFLATLCKKGGMNPSAWRAPETELYYYETESFKEN
jgi:AmmeMemoRadiSam system protein A